MKCHQAVKSHDTHVHSKCSEGLTIGVGCVETCNDSITGYIIPKSEYWIQFPVHTGFSGFFSNMFTCIDVKTHTLVLISGRTCRSLSVVGHWATQIYVQKIRVFHMLNHITPQNIPIDRLNIDTHTYIITGLYYHVLNTFFTRVAQYKMNTLVKRLPFSPLHFPRIN